MITRGKIVHRKPTAHSGRCLAPLFKQVVYVLGEQINERNIGVLKSRVTTVSRDATTRIALPSTALYIYRAALCLPCKSHRDKLKHITAWHRTDRAARPTVHSLKLQGCCTEGLALSPLSEHRGQTPSELGSCT